MLAVPSGWAPSEAAETLLRLSTMLWNMARVDE